MAKVDKSELISRVAGRTSITKTNTGIILNAIIDEIEAAVQNGEEVIIKGFGSFKIQEVKARKGRNIHAGTTIEIPAHRKVKFTPGKELSDKVQ